MKDALPAANRHDDPPVYDRSGKREPQTSTAVSHQLYPLAVQSALCPYHMPNTVEDAVAVPFLFNIDGCIVPALH